MRFLSVNEIASQEGVSRQAIQQRLDIIENHLPANWLVVFGAAPHGCDARQQLYPLPRIGEGQRAAAQRLAALGFARELIEQITGVTPTEP